MVCLLRVTAKLTSECGATDYIQFTGNSSFINILIILMYDNEINNHVGYSWCITEKREERRETSS